MGGTELPEIETPTADEIAFAHYMVALYRKRNRITPHPPDCPTCNPTAKAMERVRDQWTVAGIE